MKPNPTRDRKHSEYVPAQRRWEDVRVGDQLRRRCIFCGKTYDWRQASRMHLHTCKSAS